jgi:hypothetical protein
MELNPDPRGPTWLMGSKRPKVKRPPPQAVYTVTLQPTGDGPPPIVRLRKLLKAALRSYGLRCVECREVATEAPPLPSPDPGSKG